MVSQLLRLGTQSTISIVDGGVRVFTAAHLSLALKFATCCFGLKSPPLFMYVLGWSQQQKDASPLPALETHRELAQP